MCFYTDRILSFFFFGIDLQRGSYRSIHLGIGRLSFSTFRTIWNGNWSDTRINLPVLVKESCPRQAESPRSPSRRRQRVETAITQDTHRKARCARYANSLGTTFSPATFLRTILQVLASLHTQNIPTPIWNRQTYGAKTVNLMGNCSLYLIGAFAHLGLNRHIAADCPHSMDVF